MPDDNPYAIGQPAITVHPLATDDAVARSLRALAQTRPWVRLLGILTAIGGLLTGIGGGVALLAVATSNAGFTTVLLLSYSFIAIVYGFAAKHLLSYASAIHRAQKSCSLDDIADALEQQKSFWKLTGICTAIILVLYLGFLVSMVAGAAFMGTIFE